MIPEILLFLILLALILQLRIGTPWKVALVLSALFSLDYSHKPLTAGIALILLSGVPLFCVRWVPSRVVPLFPLLWAAILIGIHEKMRWRIPGFSYLALSSTWDLAHSIQGRGAHWLARLLSLSFFPKTLIGPITATEQLFSGPQPREEGYFRALSGALKAFILAHFFALQFPAPQWDALTAFLDYLHFGVWNYIHLYLEFSGISEIVSGLFILIGLNGPINFDRPYLASSVTAFWKRWHMTLGSWIREHVYIAFGGNRRGLALTCLNLMAAMILCGIWHGLTFNFFLWGALQGGLLVLEKITQLDQWAFTGGKSRQVFGWFWAQSWAIFSWVIFFGKF